MEQQKNSIHSITIIKVIATLFVVYIHGRNIYGYGDVDSPVYFRPLYALFNTAVPLFFAISGYLQFRKPVEFKTNLIKKTKRLLIPFLVWNSFYVLLELIGHKVLPRLFASTNWGGVLHSIRIVFGIPFYKPPFYNPLWYVRDLFILSLFAPWIQKSLKKWPIAVFVMSVVIWFLPAHRYFRQALTFFILGGLIATDKKIQDWLIAKRSFTVITFVLILGIGTSLFDIEAVQRISIILLIFIVYQGCCCVKNSTIYGKLISYSFAIYVLHGKLLSVLQILWMKEWHGMLSANLGYCILPMFVFSVCLGASVLFKKIYPRVYAICMGEWKV